MNLLKIVCILPKVIIRMVPFYGPQCIILDNGGNPGLLLAQPHFRHQTSDALLEPAVLGGVDERIDSAAGQCQHHGQVVEPR